LTVTAGHIDAMLRAGGEAIAATSPTAMLDARVLLKWAAGVGDAQLLTGAATVTKAARRRYQAAIARRRQGEPLAYITGRKEFYGRDFRVAPGVFVPRPETELLVAATLEAAAAIRGSAGTHIVELGTGCGAVAITLALARPAWRITATDASAAARRIARINAAAHAAAVTITASDWLRGIAGRHTVIVANPPYIADNHPCIKSDGIRHEPRAALTAGADGMDDLAQIIAAAPRHLTAAGALIVEHGATQAAAVRELMRAASLARTATRRDLGGRDRVTVGFGA